ncbi:MAG: methionyl-tRNA formyltransferase [Candidatus Pacebacteria bacterium]|nr:methionyl-tRNA formyltransferase [Candidatus Paceibacterota bacterium]
MTNNEAKIVFWGTPNFAAKILEGLISAQFCPILVVTAPDKVKGRGLKKTPSEVKKIAKKWGLEVAEPAKLRQNEAFLQQLRQLDPDLFIVAAYGKIIPADYLTIPKKGALNVHPSLLPRWRGPSPIQATILAGDTETGISIILMDEEMDHGPIIKSSKLNSQISKLTYRELEEKCIEEAIKLLIETLPQWLNGEIQPIPQDHEKATYCKIIKKEDGLTDFNGPAELIERKIRAFEVWPNVYFQRNGKTYKILEADIFKDENILKDKTVGEFFCLDNQLIVKCAEKGLFIKKIQPENKKALDGYAFWCGYQKKISNLKSQISK